MRFILGVWKVCGSCTEGAWKVCRRCGEGVSEVHGRCAEGAQEVCGRCTGVQKVIGKKDKDFMLMI